MKFLYYIIAVLFLGGSTFSYSQFEMEDVAWKSLPYPGVDQENISGDLSSLEITENGEIYFVFYDDFGYSLKINKYSLLSGTWTQVFEQSIVGVNPYQVETYVIGNEMYIVLVKQEYPETMFAWKMNENEAVIPLFEDQTTSMDYNLGFDFVVDENTEIMYFASRDMNSTLFIDLFDVAGLDILNSVSLGVMAYGVPQLALDHNTNSIYAVFSDSSFEYKVHTSELTIPLAFTPINNNGEITSNTVSSGGVNLQGMQFKLNEKANNSPTIILNHDDTNPSTHRTSMPNSMFTDTEIEPAPALSSFVVAGSDSTDFILTYMSNDNSMKVIELLADGTMGFVSSSVEPTIEVLSNPAEALKVVKSPSKNRIGAFYHLPGGDGQPGGRFMLTNNPPSIAAIGSGGGCAGQSDAFWTDIKFEDLDGDQVVITNNFTSSNIDVIDPSNITPILSATGHWKLNANSGVAGSTNLSFEYTDGIDTLVASIIVDVVDPITANFESSMLAFCNNENTLNLNQFVDRVGGGFNLDGVTSEDGSFELDDLIISIYPYNSSITYTYEDINGCETETSAGVTIYEAPSATLTLTGEATCLDSVGELQAEVTSPNGSYESYWNTGSQNTLMASNLVPGTYYFNVIDEVGCIYVAQENVSASDLVINADVTDPSCFNGENGAIDLNIVGGDGNHNILWSTGHSSSLLTNLRAGNYQVWVRGADGCIVSKTFNLENPPKFTVNYQVNPPTCGQSDGTIDFIASNNGTTPLTYEWGNGEITENLSGVSAGHYEVVVKDGLDCVAKQGFNVNAASAPMVAVEKIRKSRCGFSNGKIDISVTPTVGEQITSVEWSNGATTEDVYGLAPDVYECVVSQTNGCTAVYEWNVGVARPVKPEICIVSVDTTTNTNLIVWEKEVNNPQDIEYYKIYRETAIAHNYRLIDTVHHSNISVFNDVVASPANRSWRYRITAVNSCGVESTPSRSHKTIHLVTQKEGDNVTVTWDNYEGFIYNNYSLLRYTNEFGWEVIEPNIAFVSTPSFVDTPPSIEGLDYMIEVTPPSGICTATFGKAQDYNSSRSNKPTSVFNPGDGTGDPNNSVASVSAENFTVAVYPNPSNGVFKVALNHKLPNANLKMDVIDFNGKVIFESQVQNGENHIQLKNIQTGMYFVKLYDATNSETIRIVVQ